MSRYVPLVLLSLAGATAPNNLKPYYRQLFVGDIVPTSPQSTPKIERRLRNNTAGFMPGYTGAVPGERFLLGGSYGQLTASARSNGAGINAKESRRAMNRASLRLTAMDNSTKEATLNRAVKLHA